ncbi:hypothetical protein JCM19992_04480 [Thermostilla marina]
MNALPFLMLLVGVSAGEPFEATLSPVPMESYVLQEPVLTWTPDAGVDAWQPVHNCAIRTVEGALRVDALGDDPYFHRPINVTGEAYRLSFRARNDNGTTGSIYWVTDRSRNWGEDKSRHFRLHSDGKWHDYTVDFQAPGRLLALRIDPGGSAGFMEFAELTLRRMRRHPIGFQALRCDGKQAVLVVKNEGDTPLTFHDGERTYRPAPGETVEVVRELSGKRAVESVRFRLESPGVTPIERVICVYHDDAPAAWKPLGTLRLDDGSPAVLELDEHAVAVRLRQEDRTKAVVAPLVWEPSTGALPEFTATIESAGARLNGTLGGRPVNVVIRIEGDTVVFAVQGQGTLEGPVVRVPGSIEQGLLAGVEHLGKGEHSSTKLDIETDEFLRFAPDPLKITMPLMHISTAEISAAVLWRDMWLQPTFAVPNFYDAANESRMSLRGEEIQAVVRFGRHTLEDDVLWAVRRRGLPPLPAPPRSRSEQWELCRRCLTEGPIHNENGWGHCVEDRWPRNFFADIATAVWRLTGEIPELPRLVPGGSHIRDEAIYFVTGRAEQWLAMRRNRVQGLIRSQQPDGSYRYDGKYARGHFENTASGVCARPAFELLDFARLTGDAAAREAGLRTLEYMKRFRTPRGAQVWEIPLHTPDILASGYLVLAYVRGYQLTGDETYLAEARRWALSGVPFVYQWGRYPIMTYATIPVLGATNWRAPNWIGLPVQWCGLVYAYGLAELAPLDDTLDWHTLAEGILIAGEQMQVPPEEGALAGLLPDSFTLDVQRRNPAMINPAGLVALRLKLEGRSVDLNAVVLKGHHVAGPFPLVVEDDRVVSRGKPGIEYQVVIDGTRVVSLQSTGSDTIPLE